MSTNIIFSTIVANLWIMTYPLCGLIVSEKPRFKANNCFQRTYRVENEGNCL